MGIALDPAELIDFTTFQPRSQIYKLDRKRAQWEQSNKGKSNALARSRGSSTRSNGARRSSSTIHVVRKGDTLGAIARRYGTTVNRLCKLNGIKANTKLQLGKRLKIK
jgi:LysM repeat protein